MAALCFLMAAAVNAGFALNLHPAAIFCKLSVYGASAVSFALYQVVMGQDSGHGLTTYALEVAFLFFFTQNFISVSARAFQRRKENEKALIASSTRLNELNLELAKRGRDMRKLSLVAKHANDSVILFEPDMTISWVNQAFAKLTGFSREEVIGRKPWEFLSGPGSANNPGSDELAKLVSAPACNARILSYAKDGRPFWVDMSRVPVYDANGQIETLISIERDVTDTVRHEEEMAEARIQAEEGARSKTTFLATMSHEMRTPLNAIVGMSDLLAEEDLGKENDEYVSMIQTASVSLLSIINDVLDYSRLEAGKVQIEQRAYDPGKVIQETARLLRAMAHDKGLSLDLETDGTLPELVLIDGSRLRQILVNLIGNAIKFTETGGVCVRSSAAPLSEGWLLRIVVEDTGIGVPEDRAEHIFGEFHQADAETTRRFGGTGLGLAISQALARRMGGDIRLMPAPASGGSAFEVTVALGRPASEEAVSDTTEARSGSTITKRMRVLVAEDNATNRLLVNRCLKDQPVEVIEAENGREAVEVFLDSKPDVILMDMAMPELDGVEATRLIRSFDAAQPHIAALTANAFESDRERCAEAGMDDFITKPLRKKDLIAALARAERGEKPLSPQRETGVSQKGAEEGAESWTSPLASGTTNGKSIRSSDR
ncbi:response regulator [Pacificoceanicola onchidii]|uniref:response regulator n=1 Tax=Pacificoceanicola onchidii TaxID=2562685 RepID=UPI0014560F10|nr:response regulator [Pacificoceanicola onchidii]